MSKVGENMRASAKAQMILCTCAGWSFSCIFCACLKALFLLTRLIYLLQCFEDLLRELCTDDVINDFKKRCVGEYLDIFKEFEVILLWFSYTFLSLFGKKNPSPINNNIWLSISQTLVTQTTAEVKLNKWHLFSLLSGLSCSKLTMLLVNLLLKLWSLNMAYMLIFFAEKMWVAFALSYSHFFSKNTCEFDTVLTRTVNVLPTNELVKLMTLWTTGQGPVVQSVISLTSSLHFNSS